MSRVDPQQNLNPSILDRLIDEDPKRSREANFFDTWGLRAQKAAVRRDLETLLNTQATRTRVGNEHPEVRTSVLTYGMPDLSTIAARSDVERARLCQRIQDLVARFEPRLRRVEVDVQPPTPLDRSLRFRIDALLWVDPSPEPISFNTVMESATGLYKIQDSEQSPTSE